MVTHDAYGGVTGHPDHVQTHRVTRLAVEAAGRGDLYPEAGEPWRDAALHLATHPRSALPMLEAMIGTRKARHVVPDEDVTVSLDVSAWLEQKVAAIMAHRTEVERGALPALVSGLTLEHRTSLLGTEWYSSVACATGQWVGLDPR